MRMKRLWNNLFKPGGYFRKTISAMRLQKRCTKDKGDRKNTVNIQTMKENQ
jgi:hypothetical protein